MNKVSALLLVVAAIIICAVLLPVETEAATVDSGTLDNITWVLNDQGVLTISGEGRMPIKRIYVEDLGAYIQYPWHYKRANIKEIVIEEGITTVAEQAFSGCKNLKKVSLPSTITKIEKGSFYDCEALTSIVIPNGVEYIQEYAFYNCSSLASIDIPSSVIRIYEGAFRDCAALEYLIIHEGVRYIKEWVFANSGVKYVQIPVSITYINKYVFYGCNNLSDVYYTGTSDQWEEILIEGYSKDQLLNANIHYSSQAPCRNHPYGQFTKISDTQHSRTCAACGYVEKANHTWNSGDITKAATCKEEGVKICTCTSCNATKTEEIAKTNNHSYGSWTDLNNGSHKHICSVCKKEETKVHTWNAGTVTKKASCKETGVIIYTCTGCSSTKNEIIAKLTTHTYNHACDTDCNVCGLTRTTTHNYNTTWSKDKSNHWHECSVCKDKKDVAAHTPGAEATETTAQTCTTCGYVIKAALGHKHSYATTWTTDTNGHWYACSGCEEKGNYAEHDFENACDKDCSICGYTRDVGHSYAVEWTSDSTNHWHECAGCGGKADEAVHEPGAEATETTAQTCTICGYEIAPALGVKDTEPTTTPVVPTEPVGNSEPSADSTVWIIVAVAVVLLGGGAAGIIIWKKKH